MFDFLRLCRPHLTLPLAMTYLLTLYYAMGGLVGGQWPSAAASTAALALLVAFGHVMNDVCDVAADRINNPRRPLAAGRVTRREGALLCGVLLASSGMAAAWTRPAFMMVLGGVAVVLALYNLLSKRMGVVKPFVVAALAVSIYPLAVAQAGGAIGPRRWALAAFAAWFFLTMLGYQILKDLRDAAGDQAVAPRPSALQRQPQRWQRIAAIIIWAGAALLVAPAMLGCGWVYFYTALIAMAAAALAGTVSLKWALRLIYIECLIVGAAAAVDIIILGF